MKNTPTFDVLLAEKYQALSDSQLLALMKADLSDQTEKSLSIALAELETRKNLDWREMSIVQTRVKEAILRTNSQKPIGYYTNIRSNNTDNLEDEKAKKLITYGIVTAGISVLVFLWGYSYTNNFANSARAGLAGLVGQADSTYRMTQLAVLFGVVGVILGIILAVVGFNRRST